MSALPPDGARRVPLVNLANGLTAARICVVPVFGALVIASQLTHPGWRIAACVAFGVASLTDYADGWIARSWNLVTAFGKVADPIADKALTGTALVLLSVYGRVPWWITIVILLREWGVTALRFVVIKRVVIAANRGGKLKTALQILAIAWCLAPLPGPVAVVGGWLMVLAAVVTVITGLDYVVSVLRLPATPATGTTPAPGVPTPDAPTRGAPAPGAPAPDAPAPGVPGPEPQPPALAAEEVP